MTQIPSLRAVHPVSAPLGLYFRAGRNDHTALSQLLATDRRSFFGIVFEAGRVKRHKELIEQAEKSRLECILDPCTQASATVGGYSKTHGDLPWGNGRQQFPNDFRGANQQRIVESLAEFMATHKFTQLITPSHLIRGADDEWFPLDIEVAHRLREQLDRIGAKRAGLIYSLALPYATFRNEDARDKIIQRLEREGVPAQSIWLKVDGCGLNSSPAAVRNYIEAATDFHHLDLPIIGDQIGGLVGLSLLSLSAVGGIAHGLTLGEQFNTQHWRHPPNGKSHMLHPRVYFQKLDLYLKPVEARSLFEASSRIRASFGCSDPTCCPRGIVDMIEAPARHFLIQRMRQVSALAQIPEQHRAREFLERYVRPTTDEVLRFMSSEHLNEKLQKHMIKHRKRLDALRVSLGNLVDMKSVQTRSNLPATRAAREGRMPGTL
jgi:hypothetical protein